MIDPPPPAELAFLTDVIGAEATLALIEARGGTRVYVPKETDQDNVLAKIVGATGAAALAAAFGGCYVAPPLAKHWRVLVYRAQSLSGAEIALRIGCAERTVTRYLRDAVRRRPTSMQDPLRTPRKPDAHAPAKPRQTELLV